MKNTKYQQLLTKTQEKIDENKASRKQSLLERHHLYEEVYGEKSDEYPFSIFKDNETYYYKKVYEDISLEALEVLEDLIELSNDTEEHEKRPIPFSAPTIIGFIYIVLAIVIGLAIMADYFFGGLMVIAAGIVTGVLFLSIGHIIKQLNIIIYHVSKENNPNQ